MKKKSFANRLILYFSCVVFVGFLVVYFSFNAVVDNYIRSEAAAELNHEVLTVMTMPVFNVAQDGFFMMQSGFRTNRAILNVNTLVVDGNGNLLIPSTDNLPIDEVERVEALVDFWYYNRHNFATSDDMLMALHAGHAFYMRATGMVTFTEPMIGGPLNLYAIMYTDVTPAMNLKDNMNQILLGLLAISGTLTLTSSIVLAIRFKKSINQLSNRAQIIGQGDFERQLGAFSYSEFENLANNMNDMASMLATYETNQKQFFQNASHELRTPLMSIQGYTEGLKLGVFENINDATDIILEESHKMIDLINDILYLSRLGANESSRLDFNTVLVDNLVNNCIDRVSIIAEKAEKQVVAYLGTVASLEMSTDKEKLEIAIVNILANAVRYAKNEVQITAVLQEKVVKIIITNDGPLINDKDLPHIFDRFYKGVGGNTGLGLAITKDIITRLGGHIEALNTNEVVQFVITLPF